MESSEDPQRDGDEENKGGWRSKAWKTFQTLRDRCVEFTSVGELLPQALRYL